MANVAFKRGLHSALPQNGAALDGVFYLTTDSHRLYVGQGTNLIDLNKYIRTVVNETALNNLPNKQNGDFAYVEDKNILAVYNGTKWVQVNPDTNTNDDTRVTGVSVESTTAADNSKITYNFSLEQTRTDIHGGETVLTPVTFSVEVSATDLDKVVNVGVTSTAANNQAVISTAGIGAGEGAVIIKGSSNISVTGTNNEIIISTPSSVNTTYNLDVIEDKLRLTGSDGQKNDIEFLAGQGLNVVVDNDANSFSYSHKNIDTAETSATKTLTHNNKFSAVTAVVDDGMGHVASYEVTEFTLPEDKDTTIASVTASADSLGQITVSVTDSQGATKTGVSGQELFFEIPSNLEGTTFTKVYNQGKLDVYTRAQIDQKLQGVNALTYKGTVGGTSATVSALPVERVAIGDTYMVAVTGSYGGHDGCGNGDLLIATGVEENGVITSNLVWTYIPSGDDTDTQYEMTLDGTTVTLTQSTDGRKDEIAFKTNTSDLLEVLNDNGALAINHKELETEKTTSTEAPAHNNSFTVIDGLTFEAGHVIGYNEKTITLPQDENTTYTLAADSEAGVIKLNGTDGANTSITLVKGNDIVISNNAADNKITIAHEAFTTTNNTTASDKSELTDKDSFTVLKSITTDNGHVTGYVEHTYTLPADNDTTYTLAGTSAVVENKFTTTTTLSGSNGSSQSAAFALSSSSLAIASASDGASIDLVWGSF